MFDRRAVVHLAVIGLSLLPVQAALAQDNTTSSAPGAAPIGPSYGHSRHGEAFNEGPRQKAVLMKGMAKIAFPVTTQSGQAQKFFEQGISQLHGYWYFEAERSFRQAAALDPDCAMAYWGMAMANVNNEDRAKGFIAQAMSHRDKVTPREKLWIENLAAYLTADPKMEDRDKTRKKNYTQGLEKLVAAYPNDIEAKAFLAHDYLEHSQDGDAPRKKEDVDKLMNAVLAANPMHPIHHYRIHLWDDGGNKALNSAALCGPSSPGIAHMWHMQGHTYTGLRRYADAAYSQEASARVDHAYMMRTHILPDQIFNYAHNNQWLVENLEFLGRVHAALDLAKNMIELPRHPKYNTLEHGSAESGRNRLIETLLRYELWQDARELDTKGYIEPGSAARQQIQRLKLLADAAFATNDLTAGRKSLAELQAIQKDKKKEDQESSLEPAIAEAEGYEALALGKLDEAGKCFDKAQISKDRLARLRLLTGQKKEAEEAARSGAGATNQVAPLATLVEVLYEVGKKDEAKKKFEELQKLAAFADLDTPLLAKLTPIAQEFGFSSDWRVVSPSPADIGPRPPLESLGPFRWSPSSAPNFSLRDSTGAKVSLADYRKPGKPIVVIFSLGAGCEQCMAQLNAFAPVQKEFAQAGISLVAISADNKQSLPNIFVKANNGTRFDFPLLADPDFRAFKAYRAYDDFEKMPLHGVFLIDGAGLVRWQDTGYQPFKETRFLLDEAKRLLAHPSQNPRLQARANMPLVHP